MINLQDQWNKFVKSGYKYSRFTRELYTSMYTRGGFIAHFDRVWFHKARFSTIQDLDHTYELMRLVPDLERLLSHTPTKLLVSARVKVAKAQVAQLELDREDISSQIIMINEYLDNS